MHGGGRHWGDAPAAPAPQLGMRGTSAATAGAETGHPAPICCGQGLRRQPAHRGFLHQNAPGPSPATLAGPALSTPAPCVRFHSPPHSEKTNQINTSRGASSCAAVTSPLLLSPSAERDWTTANGGCFCWWLIMHLSLLL